MRMFSHKSRAGRRNAMILCLLFGVIGSYVSVLSMGPRPYDDDSVHLSNVILTGSFMTIVHTMILHACRGVEMF